MTLKVQQKAFEKAKEKGELMNFLEPETSKRYLPKINLKKEGLHLLPWEEGFTL